MHSMSLNDFGNFSLTDTCEKVEMKVLLKEIKKQLKVLLLKQFIEVDGYNLVLVSSPTGGGGQRYWFKCPLCTKRCGVVYRHTASLRVGCRQCLHLRYRKSAKKGMIENKLNFGSN